MGKIKKKVVCPTVRCWRTMLQEQFLVPPVTVSGSTDMINTNTILEVDSAGYCTIPEFELFLVCSWHIRSVNKAKKYFLVNQLIHF